jgi:predicted transcriptional regulator
VLPLAEHQPELGEIKQRRTGSLSADLRRMDVRKLVGRNVKRIRQEKGLTQEQLAEVSGFSQQYISGLEQGRRNPTVVSIYELATALGVSHMELVRPDEGE